MDFKNMRNGKGNETGLSNICRFVSINAEILSENIKSTTCKNKAYFTEEEVKNI